MREIVWTDEFSVGNNEIDAQHKNILSIYNRLVKFSHSGAQSDEVIREFSNLTIIASNHFLFEESILKQNKCPDLDKHTDQDIVFMERILSVKNSYLSGSLLEEAVSQLGKILFGIIECDLKNASYFAQ